MAMFLSPSTVRPEAAIPIKKSLEQTVEALVQRQAIPSAARELLVKPVIPYWTISTGLWISFVILLILAVLVMWLSFPRHSPPVR